MTKEQQRAESEGRLGAYIDRNIVQKYIKAENALRNAQRLVARAKTVNGR